MSKISWGMFGTPLNSTLLDTSADYDQCSHPEELDALSDDDDENKPMPNGRPT